MSALRRLPEEIQSKIDCPALLNKVTLKCYTSLDHRTQQKVDLRCHGAQNHKSSYFWFEDLNSDTFLVAGTVCPSEMQLQRSQIEWARPGGQTVTNRRGVRLMREAISQQEKHMCTNHPPSSTQQSDLEHTCRARVTRFSKCPLITMHNSHNEHPVLRHRDR